MRDENSLYWIWLSEKFGIASKDFPRFADKFDDPYDVYRLEVEELEQIEGLGERLKERLSDKSLDRAYSILKYCKKNRVSIISYTDPRYPSRLKNIENPPVLLYCLGELPDMNSRLCIGMVGTRKMSEYGKQSAYKISYELAAANVCVVSGMALGIDAVCACGAIASGGKTVAVLGCGISIAYPKEHEKLMKIIASHGAVITEYPPFERPNPQNFPKRNRLISGLCQGVLIVEGAKGSGALITASRAISQGRQLFALPGKVNESNSDGPNQLIRDGANVALCSDDIITEYDFLYHDVINYRGLAKAKKRSDLDESALERMGVTSAYYKGRFNEPVRKKPSAEDTPAIERIASKAANATDNSQIILSTLDENTRRVFELLPDGTAFTADDVATNGIDIGNVMSALTLLEISGMLSSLPGGMYIKK